MYSLRSKTYEAKQFKIREEMRKQFCFCPFCGGTVEDQSNYHKPPVFSCDGCGSIFQPTQKALQADFVEKVPQQEECEVDFEIKEPRTKSVIFG